MSSRFGLQSFRKTGRRLRGNIAESVPLDLKVNTQDLLMRIFKNIANKSMGSGQNLGHLNNLILILCNCDDYLGNFSIEDIMICLKPALVSDVKEVKAACIRAIRYLVNDVHSVSLLTRLHVDSFIIKCLDISHFNEVERIQCLRLIRKIFQIARIERKSGNGTDQPIIPKSFALCVLSISSDGAVERDRVYRTCLAILCELVVLEPLLVIENGGILILLRGILECHMYRRINEALCISLSLLLNHPASRNLLTLEFDFSGIFAPYTDVMYRLHADIEESQLREEKDMRFSASKMAIVSVLRSWSGLLQLCQTSALKAFVETLLTPDSGIKKATMSVLFEVFCMNEPGHCKDFSEALASIGPKVYQESWQLNNNFIAGEGKWFLHGLCNERLNLTNCYMAVLLAIFLESEIVQRMVDVMMGPDEESSISASIFLGGLLNLCCKLQTALHNGDTNAANSSVEKESLPDLIHKAISQNVDQVQKLQAGISINRLQKVHQFLRSPPVSHSVYFDELMLRIKVSKATSINSESAFTASSMIRNGSSSDYDFPVPDGLPLPLRRNRSIPIVRSFSSEQTVSRIKETKVLSDKNYMNWNWEAITSFLVEGWTKKAATLKEPRFIGSDDTEFQFVKKLVSFYAPDGEFSKLDRAKNGENEQEPHVQCGCHLTRFLSYTAGEGLKVLYSFLQSILKYLSKLVEETDGMNKATSAYLSSCAREYYLLLGSISMWNHGNKILERCKVFDFFNKQANSNVHESLLKLIISSLSYSNESSSCRFLENVLIHGNDAARLYATSYMRILLRANMCGFISWGVNLLITQLYDPCQSVANEALEILAEACSNHEYLDVIVRLRPSVLHLGEKGALLVCRFASHPFGFDYLLNGADYLHKELERWWDSANDRYVTLVEEMLSHSLTCFEKPNQQGGFVRRSGIKKVVQPVHLPSHLYGELCQHKKGCDMLEEHAIVPRLYEKLRNALNVDEGYTNGISRHTFSILTYKAICEQLLQIKGCLWALCHVGSSALGLNLITSDVLKMVIDLAEHSPIYSIRGTCFYCLSIVSQTVPGAERLKRLGWQSTLRKVWSSLGRPATLRNTTKSVNKNTKGSSYQSSDKSSLSAMSSISQHTPSPSNSVSRRVDDLSSKIEAKLSGQTSTIKSKTNDGLTQKLPGRQCVKCTATTRCLKRSSSLETIFCRECGSKSNHFVTGSILYQKLSSSSPALSGDLDNFLIDQTSTLRNGINRFPSSEEPWRFNKFEDISAFKHFTERYSRYKSASDTFVTDVHPDDQPSVVSKSLQEVIEHSMVFVGIAVPSNINTILQHTPSIQSSDVPLLHILQRRPHKRFDSKLGKYFADSDETRSPNSAKFDTAAFLEDMPQYGKDRTEALHKEVLRLITSLGNSFGNKADETALLVLKEKFPETFKSLSLYYDVSEILSQYSFRLTARRFIQELFHDIAFNELYTDAQEVLKKFERGS